MALEFKQTMDPDSRDVCSGETCIGMAQWHNGNKRFEPRTVPGIVMIPLEHMREIVAFLDTVRPSRQNA